MAKSIFAVTVEKTGKTIFLLFFHCPSKQTLVYTSHVK